MDLDRKLELVHGLAEAKGRQNVDDALRFLHHEMLLTTPPIHSVVTGHDENRKALTRFFKLFPDYHVSLDGYADDGDTMTFWGQAHMTMNGHRLQLAANGQQSHIDVFIQFTFRDDLIASERFFYDLAELCTQSGVSTDAARSALVR